MPMKYNNQQHLSIYLLQKDLILIEIEILF